MRKRGGGNYEWANSTCSYKADFSRCDDEDEEYEGENAIYLVQYDDQGNKLQEFSYSQFGMEDQWDIEILTVRDNELLFSYDMESYDDDEYDIYSVPVEHENGKEMLVFDKISMVCKGIPSEEFIYGDDDYLVFENWNNSIIEVCRAEKNYRKIRVDVKGLRLFSQQADEENRVIYFGGSSKKGYQGLFAYVVGGGTIRPVTSQECMSTLFATGEGKLFYTVTYSGNGKLCYDLFQYDNATGENTTLVTEEQIVEKMPVAPTEGSDMVREIRYGNGKLYMEVWAKQEKYVLCCDVVSRELTVEKGLKYLVEHTESKLDEPLHNADADYANANDQNIFISSSMPDGSIGLREYTLQGEFVRNVYTHECGEEWTLLYANNEELLFGVGDSDEKDIYSVPLRRMDGNDFPVMSEAKRVCEVDEYGACVWEGNFYADKDYLVYVANIHEAKVYDRKAGKFVKIKNMPQTNFYFANYGRVAQNRVGDCFVYCTKPYGKNDDKYAFSYWRLGEDKLTIMDKGCFTAASRVCDPARNQVIYELQDGIWCYDVKKDKRRKLLDKKDLEAFCEKHGKEEFSACDLFVDGDRLYLVETLSGCCGSFDLEKGGEIRCEEEFTGILKHDDGMVDRIRQAEGKFFITMRGGEDDDPSRQYRYYDPQTTEGRVLSPSDKEMLFFQMY